MKTFHFDKNKHGVNLLMELGVLEDTPSFFFSDEVHCTDFFEILIFRKGNGYLILDGQRFAVHDSIFIFISPFQKRQWYVEGDKIRGWFLSFEKDFLGTFFSDQLFPFRLQYFYNRQVSPSLIPQERLFSFKHDIFDEVLYEIKHFKADSPHLLRAILYYILIKLNRVFCQQHQLEPDTQLNNYAFQFKEELEQHIRMKRQVNDYASMLGISRITLNTSVKQQFGQTATEMIKERLTFEIKSALLYTTQTVAEIAFDLQFSEPNNLTRFFKKRTGMTPLVFRSIYQNDSSFS